VSNIFLTFIFFVCFGSDLSFLYSRRPKPLPPRSRTRTGPKLSRSVTPSLLRCSTRSSLPLLKTRSSFSPRTSECESESSSKRLCLLPVVDLVSEADSLSSSLSQRWSSGRRNERRHPSSRPILPVPRPHSLRHLQWLQRSPLRQRLRARLAPSRRLDDPRWIRAWNEPNSPRRRPRRSRRRLPAIPLRRVHAHRRVRSIQLSPHP
jgi:hypothetical protein